MLTSPRSDGAAEIGCSPPRPASTAPRPASGSSSRPATGEAFVGDRTGAAAFAIDNPRVATVSADGTVTPVGDGMATLTATVGGQTARATIAVEDFGRDVPWSFRNHVLPVLTKAGCNSGACHGAAAGKNGFRLTLRGYGPEVDYDVLTRQALGPADRQDGPGREPAAAQADRRHRARRRRAVRPRLARIPRARRLDRRGHPAPRADDPTIVAARPPTPPPCG